MLDESSPITLTGVTEENDVRNRSGATGHRDRIGFLGGVRCLQCAQNVITSLTLNVRSTIDFNNLSGTKSLERSDQSVVVLIASGPVVVVRVPVKERR
jgi:hypothetical protein